MQTRCKFKCSEIRLNESRIGHYEDGKYVDDGPIAQPTIALTPVKDEDPESENGKFWTATPMGSISLTINNPDGAEVFELGKEYYVDFIPA